MTTPDRLGEILQSVINYYDASQPWPRLPSRDKDYARAAIIKLMEDLLPIDSNKECLCYENFIKNLKAMAHE